VNNFPVSRTSVLICSICSEDGQWHSSDGSVDPSFRLAGTSSSDEACAGFCYSPLASVFHISCLLHPNFSFLDQPYGPSPEFVLPLEKLLESFHLGPLLLCGEYSVFANFPGTVPHAHDLITTPCAPVLERLFTDFTTIWRRRFAEMP